MYSISVWISIDLTFEILTPLKELLSHTKYIGWMPEFLELSIPDFITSGNKIILSADGICMDFKYTPSIWVFNLTLKNSKKYWLIR